MKGFIAVATILASLLAVAPEAQAADHGCEIYEIVKVAGLIDANQIQVCIQGAEEFGEVGDVIDLAIRVQVPTTTTITITITAGSNSGCTLGTATTRTWSAAGSGMSYLNSATATDTTCRAAFRVLITAGLIPQTVHDADYVFNAFCTCTEAVTNTVSGGLTITDDANGWNMVSSGFVDSPVANGRQQATVGNVRFYGPPALVRLPENVREIGTSGGYGTHTFGGSDVGFVAPTSLGITSGTATTVEQSQTGTCTLGNPILGTIGSATPLGGTQFWGVTAAPAANILYTSGDGFSCLVIFTVTALVGGSVYASATFQSQWIMDGHYSETLVAQCGHDSELALYAPYNEDLTVNTAHCTAPPEQSIAIGNASQNVTFPSALTLSFPGDADSPSLDFWMLTVFWVIILAFFLWQKWWFSAAFAIPGLLDALFPTQIPDGLSLYLVLCLLGVMLEVAAHKFSWGHWKNRNTSRTGA